jgi:hypothetical protein
MRSGKHKPENDSRTVKLSAFVDPSKRLPGDVNWTGGISYSSLGNNRLGNCAAVAAHQLVQTWTRNTQVKNYTPREREAVQTYAECCNYRPSKPESDTGVAMLTVLKRWRRHGLSTGHHIDAFASVLDEDGDTKRALKCAVADFGGAFVGFALPQFAAEDKTSASVKSWGIQRGTPETIKPYGFGGHAVAAVGYTENALHVISWGKLYLVTWGFVEQYIDEAYVALDTDWINRDGKTPSGLDYAALLAAVRKVGTPPMPLKEDA